MFKVLLLVEQGQIEGFQVAKINFIDFKLIFNFLLNCFDPAVTNLHSFW